MGFTHLRAVSGYSASYEASLPDAVAGVVRFAKVRARIGVRPLFGVDLAVEDYWPCAIATAVSRASATAATRSKRRGA